MTTKNDDVVVPVVSEEVHADAVPVQAGGVRVTKHVEGHEEILEQELRRGRVEVKRVKTERVVDGPQTVQRLGNTLVIPVVSEVLHVEKRWVVTEEIHITQIEERETVQQTVTVNQERAEVERLDETGSVVSTIESDSEHRPLLRDSQGESLIRRRNISTTEKAGRKRELLSDSESMLKKRTDPTRSR